MIKWIASIFAVIIIALTFIVYTTYTIDGTITHDVFGTSMTGSGVGYVIDDTEE